MTIFVIKDINFLVLFNKKLLLIFFLALILRVAWLGEIPYGFHNDEADAGYEGLFIIKNGHDTYGNFLPIYFDKFGDFRPTGIFYLSGISNLILGPSVFATRLPMALVGALSVFPIYLLARELFGKMGSKVWLFAAFALAILPWHVVLSRATQESIGGIFLLTFGLFFFLKFTKDRRLRFLALGVAAFMLSLFFYTANRILVPAVICALVFEVWRLRLSVKLKYFIWSALILVAVCSFILSTSWGRGRGDQVVFYNNPAAIDLSAELSHSDGPGNIPMARFFHNKLVVVGRELVASYLTYFSGDFLFMRGGYPERYLVPQQGLVFFFFIPFIVVGFATMLLKYKTLNILPLYLLLIAPLAAIFTYDDIPNINRVSLMIVPLVLLSGLGFGVIWEGAKSKLIKRLFFLSFLILFLEFIYFWHQYMVHTRTFKSFIRDGGVEEMVKVIGEKRAEYDLVVVPFSPNRPIYFLFFSNIFNSDLRVPVSDKAQSFRWENVLFVRENCPLDQASSYKEAKILFINEANCAQKDGEKADFSFSGTDQNPTFRGYVQSKI